MSKVIFILKIFIVGDRFKLSNNDRSAIRNLTEFIIYLYAYYWFKIPVASDAPFLTLQLWKDLKGWEANNKKIAIACIKKLDRHTWYIMAHHIVFSFWSKMVEEETKEEMAKSLLSFSKVDVACGKPDVPRIYEDSTLADFVNAESWLLFQVLCFINQSR